MWNIVLAIIQHNHKCPDCWKKYQINILMKSYSQTQGSRSKKDGELLDKSVPYFQQESGPCPLDCKITIQSNGDLVFFQKSWRIWSCGKIARTTFQCMVVFASKIQSKNLFLLKFCDIGPLVAGHDVITALLSK